MIFVIIIIFKNIGGLVRNRVSKKPTIGLKILLIKIFIIEKIFII